MQHSCSSHVCTRLKCLSGCPQAALHHNSPAQKCGQELVIKDKAKILDGPNVRSKWHRRLHLCSNKLKVGWCPCSCRSSIEDASSGWKIKKKTGLRRRNRSLLQMRSFAPCLHRPTTQHEAKEHTNRRKPPLLLWFIRLLASQTFYVRQNRVLH